MSEPLYGESEYVYGIGCDVFEIKRMAQPDEKKMNLMAKRILHEDEFADYEASHDKERFLAVRFSVKESIAKSIKTGFRGFGMSDICIIKRPSGAPEVLFYGRIKDIIDKTGIVKVEITISHDGGLVFTNAIALKK